MLYINRTVKGILQQKRPASSRLTACLCLLLLLRTTKGLADDDDQIDYRHEYYQEDANRMTINTDSVYADVGINSHVRINGDYVEDGITGATPTGAPAYSQLHYPTYAYFYNQAYNQNLQAALAENSYLASQYPSLQAFTNAVVAQNPQIGTGATNAANTAYSSLTNNPNYKRNSVELEHMHDHRRAESIAIPITFGINTFTPQFSESKEHDYHSYGMSFNDSVLLNQKNTTLNAGWSLDDDRVLNIYSGNFNKKISNDFLVGLDQILTPKSYMTFAFTYGTEHGYLSDPYRGVALEDVLQVPTGTALIAENRPGHRDKETFYMSYTRFFTPANGSIDLGYRFFHDTSEIFAQTAEVSWHQKLARNLVLTPLFRYYFQTAANYYYVVVPDTYNATTGYQPAPEFYSADYRLSEMETFTYGLSLTYRVQKHISLDLSYTRYIMQGLDGITSQSAYPSANVLSAGLRLWF